MQMKAFESADTLSMFNVIVIRNGSEHSGNFRYEKVNIIFCFI